MKPLFPGKSEIDQINRIFKVRLLTRHITLQMYSDIPMLLRLGQGAMALMTLIPQLSTCSCILLVKGLVNTGLTQVCLATFRVRVVHCLTVCLLHHFLLSCLGAQIPLSIKVNHRSVLLIRRAIHA